MKPILAVLFGIVLMVATMAGGGDQSEAHGGHPQKSLLPDRWYQQLSDSGSYVTWMTLTGHRHNTDGSESLWGTPITQALDGYNNSANPGGKHTVYIQDVAPQNWHDVHIWPRYDGCFFDGFGAGGCTAAEGAAFFYDEALHICPQANCDALHSRPNTWWYVAVVTNETTFQDNHGSYSSGQQAFLRRGVASEEFGHAIGLAHESGSCGTTVMDSNCQHNFSVSTAQSWDSCGINHAYYDPNWGFSGC